MNINELSSTVLAHVRPYVIKQKEWFTAHQLKTIAWTDAVQWILESEAKWECSTLEDAMKNPMFQKAISLFCSKFFKNIYESNAQENIPPDYWTRAYWDEHFFSLLNNSGELVENQKLQLQTFIQIIRSISKEKYWFSDPQIFLEKVFKKSGNAHQKYIPSVFRDSEGTLDVNKILKWLIEMWESKMKSK